MFCLICQWVYIGIGSKLILIMRDCKIIQQSVILFSPPKLKAPVIMSFSGHILSVVRLSLCSSVSTSVRKLTTQDIFNIFFRTTKTNLNRT